MSFGKGFAVSPLSASSIQNFAQDVLAIAGGGGGGDVYKNQTNTFTKDQIISGNLGVDGTITAKQYSVTYITSSILYTSGSTKFGDTSDDTHQFTGSVLVSGTITSTSTIQGTTLSASNLDLIPYANTTWTKAGRISYDSITGDAIVDTNLANFQMHVGQQIVVRVRNNTASTIARGKAVYISGSAGSSDVLYASLADYSTESTSARTLGLIQDDILAGNDGWVIQQGYCENVDTRGLNAGASLYLSSSGDWTISKPQAPYHDVRIGTVTRSQSQNGSIFVRVQNGYELDEIHDAQIIGASTGDLLVRGSDSLWHNSKFLSGAYTISGSINGGTSSYGLDIGNSISGGIINIKSYDGNAINIDAGNTAGLRLGENTSNFVLIGKAGQNVNIKGRLQPQKNTQTITSTSDILLTNALSQSSYLELINTSGVDIALNSAPTISATNAFTGAILVIANSSTSTGRVGLKGDPLISSKLRLGSGVRYLNKNDTLTLMYDGTYWNEIGCKTAVGLPNQVWTVSTTNDEATWSFPTTRAVTSVGPMTSYFQIIGDMANQIIHIKRTSTSSYTSIQTPTITGGTPNLGASGVLSLIFDAASSGSVTIQDNNTYPGTLLKLGSGSRTLQANSTIQFVWNGTYWCELSYKP